MLNEEQSEEQVQEVTAEQIVEEVVESCDEFEKKYNELNETYLRLRADFDNYKRRSLKEKTEIAQYTMAGFLTKLLPVIDNFDRALNVSEEEQNTFYNGIKMIATQLSEVLISEGLEVVASEGESFDPNRHNAIMTDSVEDVEDDVITAELQKGYSYKEKVIRPALVKVNRK